MRGGGLVAKTRCGNSWINGVGISTNPRDEEGKAIGGAVIGELFNDTTRHDTDMRGNEERKRGIPKPREQSYTRTPGCQKKERDSRKRKIRYPPTSPVLITNSQKWNAGPPCHQHCKATALEGAAGKCPTKGAKV